MEGTRRKDESIRSAPRIAWQC